MASRGKRFGARAIDTVIELIAVVVGLSLFGRSERPFAALAIVWLIIAVYETVTTTWLGATPGKLAVGLRVVAIDQTGRAPLALSAKRASVNAAFSVLPVVGWILWLISPLTDPLGRGIADRAANTMVVPRATFLPIAARDLAGYADGARPPRMSAFGRVGDLDVRTRSRLRRVVDAPVLAAAIGLLALAASLPVSTTTLILGSSSAWVVLFVFDETRRVHRTGATAGHRLAGLVIRDHRTGQSPTTGRSFARALMLGLTLYVPLLWPFLLLSLAMMRFNRQARGLHDFVGRTVVVADPSLDPEAQRQRAMRMRLGRAV